MLLASSAYVYYEYLSIQAIHPRSNYIYICTARQRILKYFIRPTVRERVSIAVVCMFVLYQMMELCRVSCVTCVVESNNEHSKSGRNCGRT